jgi:hypothetical protein
MRPCHEYPHYIPENCASKPEHHYDGRRHHSECYPLVDVVRQACELLETGPRMALGLLHALGDLEPFLRIPQLPPLTLRRGAGCGCEIPPPCWAPRHLEDICSHVCPGGTATLRLRITNCGATSRDFKIDGTPTINPATLTLAPMERGYSVISATTPPDASFGQAKEYLVWVRGCHEHFLRWTVLVSPHRDCECKEVLVEDCTDPIHHWYDHFYCVRSCDEK